jgi:hypothetical protein
MRTRVGKIARLPHDIREELNRRLADGVPGLHIVAWLKTLPEVQKVMAEQFGGRTITHQNVAEWRRRGYAEWAASRTDRAEWQDLLDHLDELNQQRTLASGKDVTGHLGTLVVLELAKALDQLGRMKNSDERWRIFSRISRSLSRLRMDDCRAKRVLLWDAKASRQNEQCQPLPTIENLKNINF